MNNSIKVKGGLCVFIIIDMYSISYSINMIKLVNGFLYQGKESLPMTTLRTTFCNNSILYMHMYILKHMGQREMLHAHVPGTAHL